MGRFGNVMLVAGEPELELTASRGEVVRLYLTNTANTRVFNVTLPGARMKLVGADSGHYEHEQLVEEVLIAPSERVVVDVHFMEAGEFALEHRTPERTYRLATVAVERRAGGARPHGSEFDAVADERRHAPSSGSGSPRSSTRRPTRRWRSWPRWTWAPPKATCRLRLSDAPRGRQRGAGQAARSAA